MKNKKSRIIKKILVTSAAASALIAAALLLAVFFIQKQTQVQQSGASSALDLGQLPDAEASGQEPWNQDTAREQDTQEYRTQTDRNGQENGSPSGQDPSDARDSSGQSRLDTSYHPRQSSLEHDEDPQRDDSEESGDDRAELTGPDGGNNQAASSSQAANSDQTANDQSGVSDRPEGAGQTANSDQEQEESRLTAEDLDKIQNMTLEEKIAQLFVLTPEALTNTQRVTRAGETTKKAVQKYPVGGLVYFKSNINTEEQFVEMVQNVQKYGMERSELPFFICVDEEGGSVARISGRGFADVPEFSDMYEIGKKGNGADAYDIGKQIGKYLSRFQVNVDFAPVADVYSNPENKIIAKRAFGSDPDLAAKMAANEVHGLKSQKVAAVLKHFPGHGDTEEDSHSGRAYSYKTLEELRSCELIPFRAGIEAGADFVMAGHISLPNILDDERPASLSHKMITEVLRGELEFDGIVITDALNMGAVTEHYSSAEAAVQAVSAGVDMLLMPQDFKEAYDGLLKAVREGTIKESRIDESLERILRRKKQI